MREVCGFSYQEFTNLRPPLPLKSDPFRAGEGNAVSLWDEYLVPEAARALAYYNHPVFGAYPAVTRNEYGKGWLIYEGTYLADALQEKVVAAALAEARIEPAAAGLPAGVKVKQAVLADGAAVRAYLNFSGARKEFVYRGPSGSELLTGRTNAPSSKVVLGPWDLAIIREYCPPHGTGAMG